LGIGYRYGLYINCIIIPCPDCSKKSRVACLPDGSGGAPAQRRHDMPPAPPPWAPATVASGLPQALYVGVIGGALAACFCVAFLTLGGTRFCRALTIGTWLRCSKRARVGKTVSRSVRYEAQVSKYGVRHVPFGKYAFEPSERDQEAGAAWAVSVGEFKIAGRALGKKAVVVTELDPRLSSAPGEVVYDAREPRRHFLRSELTCRGLCQLCACPAELNGGGGLVLLAVGVGLLVVPFTIERFHLHPSVRLLSGLFTIVVCLSLVATCLCCNKAPRLGCIELRPGGVSIRRVAPKRAARLMVCPVRLAQR
jgi:hypothetical protein